ncbi:cyclic nucleotide-binding domain-containing protein, partial [Flavobacteriaceae bacterium]|nr:cyclic nucleotide-binding domain-containing protein [Flavobacteriaceae bacterium]
MPNRIIEFLSKTKKIPQNEIEILSGLVTITTLQKGEFIYHEGKIPKHGAFVITGLLREFYTDAKGIDYIRRFAYENWWMVDLYELLKEKPALCSVQALETSEIFAFTKENCEILIEKCPVAATVLKEISSAAKYSLSKKEKRKRSLTAQ